MVNHRPQDAVSHRANAVSRRVALVLGSLAAFSLALDENESDARKARKTKLCLDGKTIKASKKKKKALLRKGAVRGACRRCKTNAECGSGSICWKNVCQICSVTCNGDSLACGENLNQRLSQGGTVYVCPGRYAGGFTMPTGNLIGAGDGEDPATSTILDGRDEKRVLETSDGATVSLSRLRITRGRASTGRGGGVFSSNGDLYIDQCTVENNYAAGNNLGGGGGIATESSRLTMTNSTIANNLSTYGGGIHFRENVKSSISSSRIIMNKAIGDSAEGGGIASWGAPLSVSNTEISGNSASRGGGGIATYTQLTLDATTRVTNNVVSVSGNGGGINRRSAENVVQTGGAAISGNVPDNIYPPL